MKKTIFPSIILVFLVFASCSDSGKSVEDLIEQKNLPALRARKSELSEQQKQLSNQIARLNAAIEKLDKSTELPLVKTEKISDTLFKHYFEVPGDVETDQNIVVYPEYSGILLELLVEEGDRVEKGAIIARIDDGGLRSQLAQLETKLALAKTTFERQERLWEQNIGSEIQFLEAKTNFEAVQNSVEQLQSQLSKTIVRAPFSGYIDEVFSEQGEVVTPGRSRLFRLINLSDMYVTADVPEAYLGRVRKGSNVIVELGATGSEFTSEIQQVGNFINPDNRTFDVKVSIPDSLDLVKPNLIATLRINDYTSRNAIVISEGVIQKNAAGESVVFVFLPLEGEAGKAEKRILETGLVYKDQVEVLNGLDSGDLLISEGAKNVQDGEKIQTVD